MTRIFISHSYADEDIAFKLVNFLLAALEIKEREILCTSNPDQGLSYKPSAVTDQLKQQLIKSEAIIIIITVNSLQSAWVPFEAGAFWTTDKPIIPILAPGITHNDLPGPLRSFLSIAVETSDFAYQLNNAINQLAKSLNIQQELTRRRDYTLNEFADSLRDCQSQVPVANSAQLEEIERLKAKITKLEQDFGREREQYESEIEQNQAEKEKLIQSLQSQITKLQEELEKEKKQIEQLQVINANSQQEKEALEKNIKDLQSQIEQLEAGKTEKEKSSEETTSFTFEVITVDKRGQIVSKKPGKAEYFREELGDDVNLDLVYIPGGKFLMGTEDNVKPFYMGKYQVTQEQWQEVMGNNPAKFKKSLWNPVEQVSWDDAQEFCQKISQKTGKQYRLPSEAEWEYACRAGTTTPFHFGETITGKLANYRATNIYREEVAGEYREKTTPAGSFLPNAFGLYDMHGNVWEWCEDNWHDSYLDVPTDGSAWLSAGSRLKVIRGGSWNFFPNGCCSTIRGGNTRTFCDSNIGFRVACFVPRTT